MSKVEWAEDLSIGIDLIDDQHKMLIQHLNSVHSAVMSHQSPNIIARALSFLIDYSHFHFETEEACMAKYSYPGLASQVSAHEEFKKTLAELEQDFREDGPTHVLGAHIDALLINWLVDHINTTDRDFGKYLQENKIEVSP